MSRRKRCVGLVQASIEVSAPLVRFAYLVAGLASAACNVVSVANEPLRTIESIAAIRRLPAERASASLPVSVSGWVTYGFVPDATGFFIQGEGEGIYVRRSGGSPFPAGSRVRIEGVTASGGFAPVIVPDRVEMVESPGADRIANWPDPVSLQYAELFGGNYDSQWVEIRGVLRSLTSRSPSHSNGVVQMRGGRVAVVIAEVRSQELDAIVGTTVDVRAVALSRHRDGQYLSTWLATPSFDHLQVVKPSDSAVERSAPVAIKSLLTFDPDSNHESRAKVRGVVLHSKAPVRFGEPTEIRIRDDTGTLLVQVPQARTEKSIQPRVGALIEAIGFPTSGTVGPRLSDASVTTISMAPPSPPIEVPGDRLDDLGFNGELIRTTGRLIEVVDGPQQTRWLIGTSGIRFVATGPSVPDRRNDPRFQVGCHLQVTGVHHSTYEFPVLIASNRIGHLEIMMRSLDDLELIVPAPYWTLQRQLIAAMTAAAMVIFLGIGLMYRGRRRAVMQRQERRIAENLFSAVTTERARLARELHDGLAQGLTGVSMQIECARDALADDVHASDLHLRTAGQLVRQSLDEARRSIGDMRSSLLDGVSLAEAIERSGRQLTDGSGIDFMVTVEGTARPMAVFIESHLFRIAQEAITNAVRHSGANELSVVVRYDDTETELTVLDNGRGVRTDEASGGDSGDDQVSGDQLGGRQAGGRHLGGRHLGGRGLAGIQERVRQLGGQLDVQTQTGRQTRLQVRVPA